MDSISITKKIDRKNLVLRYIILAFCMFCSALLFNLVQLPTNLVSGGTSGVAIILDEIFHFDPAMTILALSIVLLLFSFVFWDLRRRREALLQRFYIRFLLI